MLIKHNHERSFETFDLFIKYINIIYKYNTISLIKENLKSHPLSSHFTPDYSRIVLQTNTQLVCLASIPSLPYRRNELVGCSLNVQFVRTSLVALPLIRASHFRAFQQAPAGLLARAARFGSSPSSSCPLIFRANERNKTISR